MDKTICELFAGVGGFRLGFDRLASAGRQIGSHNGNREKECNGHTIAMLSIMVIFLTLMASITQVMISASLINQRYQTILC